MRVWLLIFYFYFPVHTTISKPVFTTYDMSIFGWGDLLVDLGINQKHLQPVTCAKTFVHFCDLDMFEHLLMCEYYDEILWSTNKV